MNKLSLYTIVFLQFQEISKTKKAWIWFRSTRKFNLVRYVALDVTLSSDKTFIERKLFLLLTATGKDRSPVYYTNIYLHQIFVEIK